MQALQDKAGVSLRILSTTAKLFRKSRISQIFRFIRVYVLASFLALKASTALALQTFALVRGLYTVVLLKLQYITAPQPILPYLFYKLFKQVRRVDLGRLLSNFKYFSATFNFNKPLKSGPAWTTLLFLVKREGQIIFLTRAAVYCSQVEGTLGGSFLLMRLLIRQFLLRSIK